MSLFVGNISRNVDQKTIESAFTSFGPCKFEFRHRYAFVQYTRDKDGEAAKNELHNKDFGGLKLNVEWSKKSGRFDENDRKEANRRNSRSRSENRGGGRRSPSWGRKRRSSPRYRRSASNSVHSDDCPRDKELKKRLEELKEQKKNKKDKKDSKERKDKDVKESKERNKDVKENKESKDNKDRERDRDREGKEKKEKKEKKHKDRSRERKRSKSPKRRDTREDSYRQDNSMDIPMPN
ncbi:hypothetical protein ABPG74_014303 [Tetrahymena malaccensis]